MKNLKSSIYVRGYEPIVSPWVAMAIIGVASLILGGI